MYKKYVDQIINGENKESMECLEDIFYIAMDHIRECDNDLYDNLEMKLYVIVNGKQLNEDMAKKIIMKMKPYGMKYTLEDIKNILKDFNLSLNPIDFWVVMNSAYNDYRPLFGDNLEMYVKYSKLFIDDEDAKPGKVFTYFLCIPKD